MEFEMMLELFEFAQIMRIPRINRERRIRKSSREREPLPLLSEHVITRRHDSFHYSELSITCHDSEGTGSSLRVDGKETKRGVRNAGRSEFSLLRVNGSALAASLPTLLLFISASCASADRFSLPPQPPPKRAGPVRNPCRHCVQDGFVEFFHVEDPESVVRNALMAFAGVAGIGAGLAFLIRGMWWARLPLRDSGGSG
ncbi:hypothetical protein SKAU_G00408650 [Synaphobranchus kaupii]|uniref:Uncharacterized protein n=1 Tax=Synaphobranchus kaupii TaxID=118154 RepID=A0A9Q1EAI9_SYNKA|nr:hypothetical protein SKAU_G00408650 [Synaphobranchus kaupii]